MGVVDSYYCAEEWFADKAAKLEEGIKRLVDQSPELDVATSAETARAYISIKNIHELVEGLEKSLSEYKRHLQYKVVPDSFEREGIKTTTLRDGFRVTISQLVRASIKDKEAGFEWLRSHDLGDLIQPTVNASTLSATAKSLLEEGRELPEDIFTTNIVANTSVTKVKK